MKLQKFVVLGFVALAGAQAFASVIYSQAPIDGAEGGPFSYPGQIMADNVTIASTASYNHVAFWGSMFGLGDPLSVGSTAEFSYVVRSDASGPGATLDTQTGKAAVTAKTVANAFSDMVYKWEVDLSSVTLTGGVKYWFTVMSTDIVAGFRWHNGTGPGDSTFFSSNGGTSWTEEFGSRGDLAFELGSAVPEPATYAVVGLGIVALIFKRKKK